MLHTEPRHCTSRRNVVSVSRVPARGEQWRAASVSVSRGASGRATCDPVVGMWCSGDARCGGGWRRPARLPCRTTSCGGSRGRWTRAPPAGSACRPVTPPHNFGSQSPAPSGSPTCETPANFADCPSALTSTAATRTTGAASASPVCVTRSGRWPAQQVHEVNIDVVRISGSVFLCWFLRWSLV